VPSSFRVIWWYSRNTHFATADALRMSRRLTITLALESCAECGKRAQFPEIKRPKEAIFLQLTRMPSVKGLLESPLKMGIRRFHPTREARSLSDWASLRSSIAVSKERSQNQEFHSMSCRRSYLIVTELLIISAPQRWMLGRYLSWEHVEVKNLFNPRTIHLLQKSSSMNDLACKQKFAAKINDQTEMHWPFVGFLNSKNESLYTNLRSRTRRLTIMRALATGAMV